MASARYSGDSVQKVMTVSGTHDTPIDMPCSMLHSISVVMSTLRSKLISQKPVVTCSSAPIDRLTRGSRRAIGIAAKKPIAEPSPRAPMISPMADFG